MSGSWNEQSIIDAIKDIVQKSFDIDLKDADASMPVRDSGLDSIAVFNVIMSLEDLVGKQMDDIDLPKDPTLHDVAVMVMKNLQEPAHE